MIFLMLDETCCCNLTGNAGLNHFKLQHSDTSDRKDCILVSKVIHITLAWHQNEIIWFEENLSTPTQPHTPSPVSVAQAV